MPSTTKVAVDQVVVGVGMAVADNAAAVAAPVQALDPGLAHGSGDALVVDRQARPEGQLGVHAWPTVGAPGVVVGLLDVLSNSSFSCARDDFTPERHS